MLLIQTFDHNSIRYVRHVTQSGNVFALCHVYIQIREQHQKHTIMSPAMFFHVFIF